MVRRVVFGVLVLGLGVFSACGRQITPSPTTANLAGRMVVKFSTAGAMNFSNYNYVIMFNTTPSGITPLPNGYLTGFKNYSYAFVVGAETGGIAALPFLFQYAITPGSGLGPQALRVPLGANTVQFLPNSNGSNTQFQLTFTRTQLYDPLGIGTPAPGTTPSPTPTPSATPTPGPTPSAGSTATPTPGPTPSSGPTLPPNFSTQWCVNFFVLDVTGNNVEDSLGVGGATDNTWQNCIPDINQTYIDYLNRPPGLTNIPSDPAAQLANGEIDNYK